MNETWTLDTPTDPKASVAEYSPEIFMGVLLLKAETLEPISLDPEVFKYKCDIWWAKWKHTFQKWWEVQSYNYVPIWDREGYEDIIDQTKDYGITGQTTKNKEVVDDDTTKKSTTNETINSTETGTWNETHEDAVTSDHLTENTTNTVSAFDSSSYSPHDKSDHTSDHNSANDGSSSGGDSRTRNTTDNTTYSETGTDDRTTNFDGQVDGSHTNTNDYTHSLHSWGNWGISMTVQKLKEQELRVQAHNLYEMMASIFCKEMLVRVYL